MKAYVTGDVHGDFSRFNDLENRDVVCNKDNMIVILGDAGINYYGDQKDNETKEIANSFGCTWYVFCGNHDLRPCHVKNIQQRYDDNVKGLVYYEPLYPRIKYFDNFGIYEIGGYKCAIIGGAYSIDKWYRLGMGWNWFKDEQLSTEERAECADLLKGKEIDFVMSHTCPTSYMPTDLFLPMVNQKAVDRSTEEWMDALKSTFKWHVWLFGHYHDTRIEAPHVQMFYKSIESFDAIYDRWANWDNGTPIEWYYPKSPKFY